MLYSHAFSTVWSRLKFIRALYHDFSESIKTYQSIKQPVVTFFGSGMLHAQHPYYQQTWEVAKLLSASGYGIMTGGGLGLMEAANRGALEGGGDSYSCRIALTQEVHAHPWYHVERQVESFWLRKLFLIRPACAFVVVPGGFGTLDEVFEVLTLVRTAKLKQKKLIFVNREYWQDLRRFIEDRLLKEGMIDARDLQDLAWVDHPDEVLAILEQITLT